MANLDTEYTSGRLIATSKVNGTAVYDTAGEKLDSIYDVMLDKLSGKPDFAVMSFGGIFWMGARYHPLPWNQLKYDTGLGGYIINADRSRLEGAPSYEADELSIWDDKRSNDIDIYYGSEPRYDIGSLDDTGLRSRNAI
ncbi:PRC-barrel domain-containing protein [Acidisoma silvae]|uniref:PRC-barrel domain-containing protein n=1 Tax=Acidisoma silvae TaxID=2802396 RepID=A0A964E164_9PROT|nr:PRC-barrel domain-containing protein [Acidisoma silvae]MCB8878026.1 PRC-barrel domain-containing protein [Acidisoma silvae]